MKLFSKAMLIMGLSAMFVAPVVSADEIAAFKKSFSAAITKGNPRFKVETVKKSALPGFYKVQIVNGPLLYVDKSGKHFMQGELFEYSDAGSVVNLTKKDKAEARVELVKGFKSSEMIVFSPEAPMKAKAVINVFTDVDCYYCQKLHKEVPEMNDLGIEVRYLSFPRAGVGSKTYNKLVSAWCADNPQEALTKLKLKQAIPEKTCENPVASQYKLGKDIGVTGTPAIVLNDGTLIPGYKPAKSMAKALGI